ncbi:MAG: NAD(P)-dependent oxidoreductase [Deltaproteobacteria bacterium]|nr:NAD(P)-dependent oxidoreductase [Deltaproteobacteria bacterium]
MALLCVTNYDDSRTILDSAGDALADTLIVQLSTGTGTEAKELAVWLASRGARLLIGVIMAYPSEIGTDEAAIITAGKLAGWEQCSRLMTDLGGASDYLGEEIQLPTVLMEATISAPLGLVLGVIHGALVCEKNGFPVADYAELLPKILAVAARQAQHLVATIAEDRFHSPEAALKTYAASIAMNAADHRTRNINDEFLAFFDDLLKRGVNAGYGDEELSALIKLWR